MRMFSLIARLAIALPVLTPAILAHAQISIGISVNVPPPVLPIYEQPPIPDPDYLWIPGYWAWADNDGYYWVPGTWTEPPRVGFLWTPGYWGWQDGAYLWSPGYWGSRVGFYGGINYGFGYGGAGYEGGRWEGEHFSYNTAVNNVNTTIIRNTYTKTVINNVTINRVAFNGGNGGVAARPTPQEQAVAREPHIPPTAIQEQHISQARQNRALLASENHGKPPIAATVKPAQFQGPGAVPAKAAGGKLTPEQEHPSTAHAAREAPHPETTSPGAAGHQGAAPAGPAEPGRVAGPAPRQPEPGNRPNAEGRDRAAILHPPAGNPVNREAQRTPPLRAPEASGSSRPAPGETRREAVPSHAAAPPAHPPAAAPKPPAEKKPPEGAEGKKGSEGPP